MAMVFASEYLKRGLGPNLLPRGWTRILRIYSQLTNLDLWSVDLQQLHLEDEHSSSRNHASGTLVTITELWRHVQFPFLAFAHQFQRFSPALDHLFGSELRWFATAVR